MFPFYSPEQQRTCVEVPYQQCLLKRLKVDNISSSQKDKSFELSVS